MDSTQKTPARWDMDQAMKNHRSDLSNLIKRMGEEVKELEMDLHEAQEKFARAKGYLDRLLDQDKIFNGQQLRES